MNGISPLSSNLPDQVSREAAIADFAKAGVKRERPLQDEALEAPDLKKTNLDPATSSVPVSMTIDAKSEPEEAFEMGSSELNDPAISYYSNLVGGSIQATSEQVLVPDAMVGLIIGRGGEQISRLQSESKCKIQMDQESLDQQYRICTLTGSLDAIALAKELINKVISNENDKAAMRGNLPTDTNCGGLHEMMIPGNLVARIIGKGGEIIKALQEETGAKIVIIQESREYAAEKPLRITGSPEAVEMARIRVEAVLASEMEKVGGGGGNINSIRRGWATLNNNSLAHAQTVCFEAGVQGQEVTEVISIPSSKVGLVMGRGGETIRQICIASGAHCQVDKNAPDGAREKNIVIKGRPTNVQKAKLMVSDKVGDLYVNYSNNHIGSDPVVSNPGLPSNGQNDYSQQWAEYYRSLGMLKEAEIIEQQMLSRGGGLGVAQVTSQPDYSAQWAEYYRSLGKYKEAEAIEAQMKIKGVEQTASNIFSSQY